VLNDDVQLVSVNDHVVEPPDLFRARVPSRWAEAAPTVVDGPAGPSWRLGAELVVVASTSLQEGDGPAPERIQRVGRMWAAASEPGARLAAMDTDDVAVQTLFPHAVGFAGEKLRHVGDGQLWSQCVRAYNDFVLSEYCAADRHRLVAVGILPLADPRAAADEVEHIAGLGGRGVSFPHNPIHLGLPSLYDDSWTTVFAAIESADLPLFIHIGTGIPATTGPSAPFEVTLTLATLDAMTAMTDLAFSPVLRRHPRLRVVLLESGIGWMPFLDERLDYFWERQGGTAAGGEPPSGRLRRQVHAGFIDDADGVRHLASIGADRVMWMSDFPHPDSAWPHSRERLARLLQGVPDKDAAVIAEGNARALLRLPRERPADAGGGASP
jgi:predicted TIM-barrel fold metal-dependent hydrolase